VNLASTPWGDRATDRLENLLDEVTRRAHPARVSASRQQPAAGPSHLR
jgi:hypothetical protein